MLVEDALGSLQQQNQPEVSRTLPQSISLSAIQLESDQ